MTQTAPDSSSKSLVLGINGVGLEPEGQRAPPNPATLQVAFKPFSIYNSFIDELIDGGDGSPVRQYIQQLQSAAVRHRPETAQRSPTLLARDYLQSTPPPH